MNKQEHAFSHWLFTILAALFLTACGGGGSSGLLDLQGVSTYKLGVTSSSPTLGPSGSVLISATLTDSASVAAAGQTIHFSSTGPGTLSAASAVTNASGIATVTLNGNGGAGAGAVKASYTDSGNNIVKSGISYTIVSGDNVSLTLSKNTVKSGSGDSVTLTAFVTDSSGVSQAGKLVTFGGAGAPNGSITIANGGITDTNGLVTATYFPDTTDRSNKAVVVTASTGPAVTASGTINITGTTITLTPSVTSTTINSSINLDATVTDGNGAAIGGQAITLASPNFSGGQVVASTDSSGKIPTQAVLIASAPGGIAAFTASGLGATASTSVAVSGTSFSFDPLAPAPNEEITVSTPKTVTLTYLNGNVPVSGQTVYFSTSLGTISPASAVTSPAGKVSATLTSTSAGQAVVSANTAGSAPLQASRNVLFTGGAPTQIAIQAGQTTLLPLAQTQITATVRDAAGNPVKSKVVLFNAISDPSSGAGLSASLATTDAIGQASVTFTAGALTTATNGIKIRASVQGYPLVTTQASIAPLDAQLTVGGDAVFISIGTGNLIEPLDATTYAEPHNVVITDATGAPIANQVVTLSIIPIEYYKGYYAKLSIISPPEAGWVSLSTATCANEDVNSDGILQTGEDINGNGKLDPGNPVTLSSATVTTGANGFASFSVLYGKNFAQWLKVRLRVTTTVKGTESKAEELFDLHVLASDVSNELIAPPGYGNSPFGTASVCTNPL